MGQEAATPQPPAEQKPLPAAGAVATYSSHVSTIAQGLGIAAATVYVLGYIVVNAYLAKFGAQSRGPFSLTYVSAGATLVFLVAVFAFAVGFRVFTINAQGKAIFDQKPTWAPSLVWFGVSMFGIVASLGFGICIASAITLMLLMRQTNH